MIRHSLTLLLALGCSSAPQKSEPTLPVPSTTLAAPVQSAPVVEEPPSPAAQIAAKGASVLYDPKKPLLPLTLDQPAALDKLFPKRLGSFDECKTMRPGKVPLETDIKNGQIVPEVLSMAEGSFTGKGLSQKAYVVDVGECNAKEFRADLQTTSQLIIMTGDEKTLVINTRELYGSLVAVDLNRDGVNEFLEISDYDERISLTYSYINKKKWIRDKNMRGNYTYIGCGPKHLGVTSSQMTIFTYEGTDKIRFYQEHFEAPCKTPNQFQPNGERTLVESF